MSAPESLRVARTPESDTGLHEEAANDAADGLIARLGRLWERGRLPSESEVRRLFEARGSPTWRQTSWRGAGSSFTPPRPARTPPDAVGAGPGARHHAGDGGEACASSA